jgi:hypothetical protein
VRWESGAEGDELFDALSAPTGKLREKLTSEDFTGIFIAFLRLDVDLDDVCLEALGGKPDKTETRDAAVRLYECLPWKGERRETTLGELEQLSTSTELGPRPRAHALAILASKKAPAESVALFEEAVRLDPKSLQRNYGLAEALARVGRKAEALERFRELQAGYVARTWTAQFPDFLHEWIKNLSGELEGGKPAPR